VFNSNSAAAFNGNVFLFVSEDGTISGWRGALGTTAEVLQTGSSANVYKGVALGTISGNTYLYAANFGTGAIDVLAGTAGAPALTGHFTDPNLPAGYAPFNIQSLSGTLYVAYAVQAGLDEMAGPGLGLVDKYDLQGNLIGRVASPGGTLNAPWGLAIAPSSSSFGAMAGALLVGNFGDGRINAYDVSTNNFLGQVQGPSGSPLSIDGLWGIAPGNSGSAGSSAMLYFAAGPNDESHGVFGVLTPVPEPASVALMTCGLAFVGALSRIGGRRRGG
jgi:uncharacterized protein (TIGR03118 family)